MHKKSLSILLCLILILTTACGTVPPPEPEPPIPSTSHKITFDTGLGSYVAPITGEAGTQISAPPVPTHVGYDFGGWYYGETVYDFFVMPDKNITLKARWVKLHKITFITGTGATTLNPVAFAEGDTIILPQNPTRIGYKFSRWEDNGVEFTLSKMPAADIVITAAWLETNTIAFSLGAEADALGIKMDPIYELPGAAISEPEPPRMPGYVFHGWQTSGGQTYMFDKMPVAKFTTLTAQWFKTSVLPSMMIDLSDGFGNTVDFSSVDRVNYVKSSITVQNADESHNFRNAAAEFRGRGNGSWYDNGNTGKKGYRIKFESKHSLFGSPKNKHYALVACTNEGGGGGGDRTMMQNAIAFGLGREVFDALEYTTRSELVDIYVNGSFCGVYLLAEIVRVDKDRINIASEYNVNDTGYLIEYDTYATSEGSEGVYWFRAAGEQKYPFTVKSPDPDDFAANGMTEAAWRSQVTWLQGKVSELMQAIYDKNYIKFSQLADVNSFVDMYLLQEYMKNTDAGWSSLFMYKKPGGKFCMGSPWDFDMSANTTRGDRSTANLYVAGTQTGSCKAASSITYSEMFHALYNTTGFYNEVVKRWKIVSPQIKAYINSTLSADFIEQHTFAMGRNFKNFSVYGHATQTAAETAWKNNVGALKNWLIGRADWLTNDGPWQ